MWAFIGVSLPIIIIYLAVKATDDGPNKESWDRLLYAVFGFIVFGGIAAAFM